MRLHLLPFVCILLSPVALMAQPGLGTGLGSGAEQPTTRALVIGISDYQNDSIDLKYAHRDAEVFAQFLYSEIGGNVAPENIRLLLDSVATIANIRSKLNWLWKNTGEGDRAIIFFSGHGDVEDDFGDEYGYLIAHDTPRGNYEGNAIDINRLKKRIQNLAYRRGAEVWLITDACKAGRLAGDANSGNQIVNTNLRNLEGPTQLLSCAPDELSEELSELGRGIFSYYLIKGLVGEADLNKDEIVGVAELEIYLKSNVPPKVNFRQNPTVIFDSKNPQKPMSLVGEKDEALVALNETPLDQELNIAADLRSAKSVRPPLSNLSDQEKLVAFEKALNQQRWIYPDDQSAAFYLEELKGKISADHETELKEQLAIALQDEVQQSINRYLEADSVEMRRRTQILESLEYRLYPEYLQKAAELLGPEDAAYPIILAKRQYFTAVNQRMEGLIKEESDPSFLKEAKKLLLKAQLELPQAAYIEYELGLIERALNHSDNALRHFKEAARFSPTWALPQEAIGSMLLDRSMQAGTAPLAAQLVEVEELVGIAIENEPEYFGNYLIQGQAQEEQGHWLEAELSYRDALMRNLTSSRPFDALGYLYLKMGDFKLANEMFYEADLRRGLEITDFIDFDPFSKLLSARAPEAFATSTDSIDVDLYKRLIALNKQDLNSFLALADHYFEGKQWAEARAMYREVLRIDSLHPHGNHRLVKVYFKGFQNYAATELFLGLAKKLPVENSTLYSDERRLYEAWGRSFALEEFFWRFENYNDLEELLTRQGRWPELWNLAVWNDANVGWSLGDPRKYEIDNMLVKLMELDPTHANDYLFHRAVISDISHEYHAKEYEDLLSLDPNYPAKAFIQQQLAIEYAGRVQEVQQSYQRFATELDYKAKRIAACRSAWDQYPADLDKQLAYIDALLDNWQYTEALSLLEDLHGERLLPADWQSRLASLYYFSGEKEKAKALRESLQSFYQPEHSQPQAFRNAKGIQLLDAEGFSKALPEFEAITLAYPDEIDAYYQHCRYWAEQGNVVKANQWLLAATKLGFDLERVLRYDPYLTELRETDGFTAVLEEANISWRYTNRGPTRYF